MPEICRFFGIVIAMFYNDHGPPHFHARYGGRIVKIAIETMSILDGSLPPRAMGLVTEWATMHRDELMRDWDLARRSAPLVPIPPLE